MSYINKIRKELQSTSIRNRIASDGTASSWFTTFVLHAISTSNMEVLLHNLEVRMNELSRASRRESDEAKKVRLAALEKALKIYNEHVNRWLTSIDVVIEGKSKELRSIPMFGENNMAKIHELKTEIVDSRTTTRTLGTGRHTRTHTWRTALWACCRCF
jgi:hypothetical protein